MKGVFEPFLCLDFDRIMLEPFRRNAKLQHDRALGISAELTNHIENLKAEKKRRRLSKRQQK